MSKSVFSVRVNGVKHKTNTLWTCSESMSQETVMSTMARDAFSYGGQLFSYDRHQLFLMIINMLSANSDVTDYCTNYKKGANHSWYTFVEFDDGGRTKLSATYHSMMTVDYAHKDDDSLVILTPNT